MFLIVCINYFFPYTEILTSEVPAKLLISHSKPTMRAWLRIYHQVSLQEWVTSQAGSASCATLARQTCHGSSAHHHHHSSGLCKDARLKMQMKMLYWCISSPTHPASRNIASGGTGRHAGRDSLVSPTSQWVCPDNATELHLLQLGFSRGCFFLGLSLINCHLQWEESCHLKSQFFKLQLFFLRTHIYKDKTCIWK